MVEVEVYAAGLREPNRMMRLALELDTIDGMHYKVDTRHDLVYMEFTQAVPTKSELHDIFDRIGLDAKFVGQVAEEIDDANTLE